MVVSHPAGQTTLHGRDAERAVIAALLDGVRASDSGVLVIRGEAGAGKSALLSDALQQASQMVVLRARGVESEAELPYAGLHQLLRPVLAQLDTLPEPQALALRTAFGMASGGANERFLVSLAVLGLLSEVAGQRPLLCLIDDAHWLDRASADALLFAARRLDAEPVAIIFAARDGDQGRFEALDLPVLKLCGLPRDAADALVTEHAGVKVAPDVCERLLAQTGGNPLALRELAGGHSPEQLMGSAPLPAELPRAAGVERLFLEQVRHLPEDTRRLMLVAAADDSGRLVPVLAAAESIGARGAALAAAEEAGLLQVRGAELEFRHPLVRSAVYHDATLSERQAAHRALARVFEAEADRRAWHLAAATVEPDENIARELEEAAERARQRGGHAAASAALERAADLSPDADARARRLVGAAEGARLAGQSQRAASLLVQARPLSDDPLIRADIDRLRGMIELTGGSPARAYEILYRAAQDVAAVDADRALAIVAVAAEAVALTADPVAVEALRRLTVAMNAGDAHRQRFLVDLLGGFGDHLAGQVSRGVRQLHDAIALAERLDEPFLLSWAGWAAGRLGDDLGAYRFYASVVDAARARGAVGDIPLPLSRLALFEIRLGRWSAGVASASETVKLARATGQVQLAAHPLAWLAHVAAFRGQDDDCRLYAAEALALTAARPVLLIEDVVRWALGSLDLGAGRAAEALTRLAEISHPGIAFNASLDCIEAAIRAGRGDLARERLRLLESWADAVPAGWTAAYLAHCRALFGDGEAAERAFAESLAFHARSARTFERARTELAFGEFLRRARRRSEARHHLRAAVEGFDRQGATAWAERARVELRASGETARKRDPSTVDQLTPQELQISRFVARGLPTREVAAQLFLSPRTVDFHLRNIFAKLGITSRAELATLFAGQREPALA